MFLLNLDSSARWWDSVWGHGHTVETDPTRKGWKCRPITPVSDVVLIGRPGVAGCAAVSVTDDGLSVAIHAIDPKSVVDIVERGAWDEMNPHYIEIPEVSGFGLRVIAEITKEMSTD